MHSVQTIGNRSNHHQLVGAFCSVLQSIVWDYMQLSATVRVRYIKFGFCPEKPVGCRNTIAQIGLEEEEEAC